MKGNVPSVPGFPCPRFSWFSWFSLVFLVFLGVPWAAFTTIPSWRTHKLRWAIRTVLRAGYTSAQHGHRTNRIWTNIEVLPEQSGEPSAMLRLMKLVTSSRNTAT